MTPLDLRFKPSNQAFKDVEQLVKKEQENWIAPDMLKTLLDSAQVVIFSGERYLVFPQIKVNGSKVESVLQHFNKGP